MPCPVTKRDFANMTVMIGTESRPLDDLTEFTQRGLGNLFDIWRPDPKCLISLRNKFVCCVLLAVTFSCIKKPSDVNAFHVIDLAKSDKREKSTRQLYSGYDVAIITTNTARDGRTIVILTSSYIGESCSGISRKYCSFRLSIGRVTLPKLYYLYDLDQYVKELWRSPEMQLLNNSDDSDFNNRYRLFPCGKYYDDVKYIGKKTYSFCSERAKYKFLGLSMRENSIQETYISSQ